MRRFWQLVRQSLVGRAVLWFVPLALPWPWISTHYTRALAWELEAAFGVVGPPVEVRFHGARGQDNPWEVDAAVTETATGLSFETGLDARRTAYLPAAVFLALVLASSWTSRRKLVVALGGLLVLHPLSWLPLLSFLSGRLPIVVFHLGTVERVTVDVLYRALVAPLGMTYAAPVLLWIAVSALFASGPAPTAPVVAMPVRHGVPLRRRARRARRRR